MFEEEKSYQFLMGLNDDLYSQTQILGSNPLLTLEKIFNIVTQEQQHKRLMVGQDERIEIAVVFAISYGERIPASSERGICKHCGLLEHEEANCFEIIRYSLGWASHRKGRGQNRGFCGGQISGSRGIGGAREAANLVEPCM